jgi:hypothetical protein
MNFKINIFKTQIYDCTNLLIIFSNKKETYKILTVIIHIWMEKSQRPFLNDDIYSLNIIIVSTQYSIFYKLDCIAIDCEKNA